MNLNKKRAIFLSVFVLLPILMASIKKNENTIQFKTIDTMATPVTSKTIVIDAGHGGEDGGAVSANGVSEASLNLEISLKLQGLLESSRSRSCTYKIR